jgi:hypothetical protein
VSRSGGIGPKGESTFNYDESVDQYGNELRNGKGRLTSIFGYGAPSTSSSLSYDGQGRVEQEFFQLDFLGNQDLASGPDHEVRLRPRGSLLLSRIPGGSRAFPRTRSTGGRGRHGGRHL